MKLTKGQLKEMVRQAVHEQLAADTNSILSKMPDNNINTATKELDSNAKEETSLSSQDLDFDDYEEQEEDNALNETIPPEVAKKLAAIAKAYVNGQTGLYPIENVFEEIVAYLNDPMEAVGIVYSEISKNVPDDKNTSAISDERFEQILQRVQRAYDTLVDLANKKRLLKNIKVESMKTTIGELKKMINEAVSKKLYENFTKSINKKSSSSFINENTERTMTWGEIPSPEELDELLEAEDLNLNLQGADRLAWDYAMTLADVPVEPEDIDNGYSLHDALVALVEAPEPDNLSDEQYDEVEEILDRWTERYAPENIAENAWSLASSIMETLDIEWI